MSKNYNNLWKGCLAWGLASLFSLYVYLTQVWPSIMIPDLSQAFNMSAGALGLLTSSYFYTYLPLQVPAGMVVDKFGARGVLAFSITFCAGAVLLFVFAKSFAVAQTARILMGVFCAPSIAGTLYLAGNWFAPTRFALLVGLTETLAMLGGVVGEIVLAQSVMHLGWRETLIFCSVFALLLGVLIWIFVKDRPPEPVSSAQVEVMSKLKILALFKLPQLWIIGLIAGLLFILPTAFAGLWAVPFLQDLYRISVGEAAVASSMVFVGIAISGPLLGLFSLRIGNRKRVIQGGSIACLLLIFIIIYVKVPYIVMVLLMLLLGAVLAVYVLAFSIAREIAPPSVRATAMSFTNLLTIVLGAPIMQPLVGYLLEYFNAKHIALNLLPIVDYKISLSVLPGCVLLAVLLSHFIKE